MRALARFMERTEPVIWGGTAAIHQPFFQSGPSGPFVPLANCKGPLGNRWSAPIGDSAVTQYRLLKHQYRLHISWKKGCSCIQVQVLQQRNRLARQAGGGQLGSTVSRIARQAEGLDEPRPHARSLQPPVPATAWRAWRHAARPRASTCRKGICVSD